MKLTERSSPGPWSTISAKRETPDGQPKRLHFDSLNSLTQREYEIMELILKGHSSLSISLALGISPDTVKIHRRHIYKKLSISSQAELFALALKS